MKSTLVIARREIVERRFVFVSALAVAALCVLIPLVPWVSAASRREVLVFLSTACAANVVIVLAAMLGSSIVGRELSEGRLSFYFSKPVPGSSIWFGKLIGCLVILFISGAIIAAPAMFAGIRAVAQIWTVPNQPDTLVAVVIGIPIVVFLLSHVVSTFVRSHSLWIVFDFFAVTVCGVVLSMLGTQLAAGFAFGLIRILSISFVVFATIAVVAAGAWQLAAGRTDRKRSHRELSRFLWPTIGGAVLILGAYVMWVVSVSPADVFRGHFLVQGNAGQWAAISGTSNGRGDYHAAFLYNLEDGRSIRIGQLQPWMASLLPVGTHAAYWLVPSGSVDELWMAKLDAPNPKPIDTKIALRNQRLFALSDDGSRLAVIGREGLLAIIDTASAQSEGSTRIIGDSWYGYFASHDIVRIYAEPGGRPVEIFEYNIPRKTLIHTGSLPHAAFRFNPDRTRSLFYDDGQLQIRDARTGGVVHAFAGSWRRARFLGDGRIAAISGDHSSLWIFASDGTPLRQIATPRGMDDFLIDIGGGRVVTTSRDLGCAVIDVNDGRVLRIETQVRPYPFGGFGSHLLAKSGNETMVWDALTGARRKLSG